MIFNLWALRMLPHLGTTLHLRGVYSNWADARQKCSGYEAPNIATRCVDAARKVLAGSAAWERDSVIMDAVHYSWPVMAEISRIWAIHGYLNVLDVGGGLGSSYLQFKSFSRTIKPFSWTVLEQVDLALAGVKEFSNDNLRFITSVSDIGAVRPNVVLLSSVLQYLPNAEEMVSQLELLHPECFIIDRTPISDIGFYTVQHVPKSIYSAAYPMRVFSHSEIDAMFSDWVLADSFQSYCDSPRKLFGGRIYRKS